MLFGRYWKTEMETFGLEQTKVFATMMERPFNKLESRSIAGAQLSNTISAKSPFVNDVFYSIMQDKKGIIWFGTKDGVVCYDGNNYTRFLDDYSIKNDSSLTLKYVQCIFEDKNGNLWFGSGPMAFDGIGSF